LARLTFVVAVAATFVTSALGMVSPGRVAVAGGSCPTGSKPAIIAGNFKCLRVGSSCASTHHVAYRKLGFSCVNGRLHRYVKPHSTPTTTVVVTTSAPAPPVYQDGHYVGTTSQFQPISFDVTSGQIQNVTSGDVNESCNPPTNLYGGNVDVPQYTLNADGTFDVDWSGNGTVGASFPSTFHNVVTGRVQGGIASGTIKEDTSFEEYGKGYICSSGLVTWTATLAS
jgi:uncharacterized protein with FMN-binding domain